MPSGTTAPVTAEAREVLRLVPPVVLWWVWVAFVVANVADFAVQGLSSARFGAVVSAVLLFVTGLAYTLALRPRVVVDSAGLIVVNPFRVHHVPWRLIRSVDTGEWVQVRYDPRAAETASAGPGSAGPGSAEASRTLHCWALYVSARARRKIVRGAPHPRRGLFPASVSGRRPAPEAAMPGGFGSAAGESSRLPDEARYLASLPVAKAIATRLDTRAARERKRARAGGPGQVPGQGGQAASSWSWPALAAAVIPALVLLLVVLA